MSSDSQKIAVNTAAQLLGKLVSSATTIVTTAIIARRFGEVDFAAFLLMTGFAAYFYLLTDFGLNAVATRELAADHSQRRKIFNSLFTFRLLESAILVALLSLTVWLIPFRLSHLQITRWGILVGLLSIFSQAVYQSCTVIFQATLTYSKLVTASVVGNLFFLSLVIFLAWRGYGVFSLVVANTLGTLVVSGISLWLAAKIVGPVALEIDFDLGLKLLVAAFPLGIGLVLTVVVAKADQFLLTVLPLSPRLNLTNDLALANYGLAYKIFENILVFSTYFVNAVYPILVKLHREDWPRLNKVFWSALYFLAGSSVLISFLGWHLAPWAVEIIGGAGFAWTAGALRLLLLSLPLLRIAGRKGNQEKTT